MSDTTVAADTSTILLAAGMARRMGTLKQLLPLGDSTLLGITLDNILAVKTGQVIVVVGAGAEETRLIAGKPGVETVFNPRYRQGMSTSLRKGLEASGSRYSLIMVALADQPLISTRTYARLISRAAASPKGIALPVYKGQRGNPILFKRRYVSRLQGLKGDAGGRELLKLCPEDILEIEVEDPGVVTNINTSADYENLKSTYLEGGW
ncbi:MAG: nucleotidyltransferase family protein [Dehalococcoidaceae bacterium]|nr:nucleotidyltransferase family protein [Dehalococcoidaceae bacterium]